MSLTTAGQGDPSSMSDPRIQHYKRMEWIVIGGLFRSKVQQWTIGIDGVPLDAMDRAQAEAERLGVPAGTVPEQTHRARPTHVDLKWQWIDHETAEMVVDPS
jgi:hypothetical protein